MKAIYDPSTEEVTPYPRADGAEIVGLDPALRVLTVVDEDQPTYDPNTQLLQPKTAVDLALGTVTNGWEVVTPKTAPRPTDRPDYAKLYGDILVSRVYTAKVVPQAMTSVAANFAATALGIALSDAAAGRPNDPALTASLSLVFGTMSLDAADMAEIDALLAASNLSRLKPV